jgi:uroporphyrinogen decarboxylase
MAKYYNDPDFISKIGNCFTWLRPVINQTRYYQAAPNIWKDEFGVYFDRTIDKDVGNVCNALINTDNIDDFEFPNADDARRYDFFDNIINANPDGFFVANIGFSLFERAWSLMGDMSALLMAMMENKDFVNKLLDKILEFNLKVIENSCSHNIDVFRFGDDWGTQNGLITGPALWREFIKPRIKKMYGLVKSKGKFVMIHSCGNIAEILPDLIECGLDVFNPFQPEVMDVYGVKKQYGDRLSFYGGISIQQLLPFGTVSQVKDEVKKLLDVLGKGGGYFASPSHDVPPDCKPENIAAMIEVLQNQ